MKKKYIVLFFLPLLLFVFIGCGASPKSSAPASTGPVSYPDDYPDLKTLERLFRRAEEAYSWFTATGGVSTDYEDRIENERAYYVRVTQYGIYTMAGLEGYLHLIFEDDICEELLTREIETNLPMFIESDGALYYFEGYIGLNDWSMGERALSIGSVGKDFIVLKVKFDVVLWENSLSADLEYTMVKGSDSFWRFAAPYELPMEAAANLLIES